MTSDPREHVPLAPHAFEILLTLSQRPMHGYGIVADIRDRTGGDVVLGTSTLYATIRRLERDGLVAEADEQPDEDSGGPPRRYHRSTELGLEVARLEARRLRRTAQAAEALLDDSVTRAGEAGTGE